MQHVAFFHNSIDITINILSENSYPRQLIEHIIHDTLEALILQSKRNANEFNDFQDKAKGRRLFNKQFRGQETTNFMNKLIDNFVPIIPIYTTCKLKNVLPSLKPEKNKELRSNIINQITCPKYLEYYIGKTVRHL